MLTHRLKILTSMIIALILVQGYTFFSQNPAVIPTQAENIKGLLSNLKFNPSSLTRLFTLNFADSPLTNPPTSPVNNNPFNYPTSDPNRPTPGDTGLINQTPTPYHLQPTTSSPPDDELVDFPVEDNDINNIPVAPTNPPKPTNKPKPTKLPKSTKVPTPPPVTTSVRPGSSLAEIFADVSKRECIPAALLYAFQTQETGPWWPINTASSKVKIYNKYGWWLDGTGNSCTGMGYHTATGVVPSDAADAGTVCQNALGGYDQGIMGILQISQDEENAAKKYITSVISGNIDRRVLFDNAVIFAIITKNRLGDPPTNCSDWPDDAIRTAAEKHYGACSDNYCENILKYYREYR